VQGAPTGAVQPDHLKSLVGFSVTVMAFAAKAGSIGISAAIKASEGKLNNFMMIALPWHDKD